MYNQEGIIIPLGEVLYLAKLLYKTPINIFLHVNLADAGGNFGSQVKFVLYRVWIWVWTGSGVCLKVYVYTSTSPSSINYHYLHPNNSLRGVSSICVCDCTEQCWKTAENGKSRTGQFASNPNESCAIQVSRFAESCTKLHQKKKSEKYCSICNLVSQSWGGNSPLKYMYSKCFQP